MNRILRDPEHDVWALHTTRPALLENPFGGEDFAVLVLESAPCTKATWHSFVRSLIKAGARTFIYVGPEPEARAAEVDWTSHDRFADLDVPRDKTVAIRAFALDGVVDAFVHLAQHSGRDEFSARRFLVATLGDDPALAERAELSAIAAFRGESLPHWPRPVPVPAAVVTAVPSPPRVPSGPPSPRQFLASAGRFALCGRIVDAAGSETTITATVDVRVAAAAWTVDGRIGALPCTWTGVPFTGSIPVARWSCERTTFGPLVGEVVRADTLTLSTFASEDRACRGAEVYRSRADGGFDVMGSMAIAGALDSVWEFVLRPERV